MKFIEIIEMIFICSVLGLFVIYFGLRMFGIKLSELML